MRLLVCMGYFERDKETAIEVIDQASALLSGPSESIGLCWVHRFDCQSPSESVLKRNRDKFAKVYSMPTQYRYEGWPGGCNSVAYTVLNHVLPKADKSVEAALILESDCVITRKDWDIEILEEWGKTKAEHKMVCGTVLPWAYHRGHSHVNATALWGRDVSKRIGGIKSAKPKNLAWDYYYGANTSLLARNSELFRLDWKRATISAKELFSSPALIYHGVKDDSARKAVRKKYDL